MKLSTFIQGFHRKCGWNDRHENEVGSMKYGLGVETNARGTINKDEIVAFPECFQDLSQGFFGSLFAVEQEIEGAEAEV
jgi:hypothetical protein